MLILGGWFSRSWLLWLLRQGFWRAMGMQISFTRDYVRRLQSTARVSKLPAI